MKTYVYVNEINGIDRLNTVNTVNMNKLISIMVKVKKYIYIYVT
jgi:hypothetical protein